MNTNISQRDNVTQQCGVIFLGLVKQRYSVGGWGGWKRCSYSNGFSRYPVIKRLPYTLAKDKQWPTWSQVVAYPVFHQATLMQRLCFACMQSAKLSKDSPVNTAELGSLEVIQLISMYAREHLMTAVQDDYLNEIARDFLTFESSDADGILRPTTQFWLSFVNHDKWVFMLTYAVKTNNGSLHHKCMADMAHLFFSQGGQNYARYLMWYDTCLIKMEVSHPGASQMLNNGTISVARSLKPSCREEVDQTMEETFMKFANLGEVSYTVYQPESIIKIMMGKHGNFMNNMTCMQTSKKKIRMPYAMQSS